MNPICKSSSRQDGFTLIEVLIAVLVLSIGLLGMAALQTASLRGNVSAFQRTEAQVLAYDILDRIRTNQTKAGSYATTADERSSDFSYTGSQAERDLFLWKKALEERFPADADGDPSGTGLVAFDASGKVATITVSWGDRLAIEAGDACAEGKSCFSLSSRIRM